MFGVFPTKYGGFGKTQYCGRHRIDLNASPVLLSKEAELSWC